MFHKPKSRPIVRRPEACGNQEEHVLGEVKTHRLTQKRGVGFGRRSTLLTAPLAAWLGEHDAPGASYHGRAAGKVSSVGGVVGRVLRGCDNHHHDRQDYRYHSQRDELGRHCVLQEVC